MPFVSVLYDPNKISKDQALRLSNNLPGIISGAFTRVDVRRGFPAGDVTILFKRKTALDVCAHDVSIVVWANYSEKRITSRDDIAKEIEEEAKNILPDCRIKLYAYVQLNQSGFSESEPEKKENDVNISGIILDTVEDLIEKLNVEGKNSGYLAIVDRSDGRLLLHAQVGNCLPDKHAKYCEISLEKAMRIYRNQDASSWMSRDPDNDKWGGAIVAGRFILSFSGLPELADEALMLALGREMSWISIEDVMGLATVSNNEYIGKLL